MAQNIGRNFIEVHHIVPVHERKEEYVVDPIKDLIPLCSNCHSMIHRRNPVYSPDELKSMLKNTNIGVVAHKLSFEMKQVKQGQY